MCLMIQIFIDVQHPCTMLTPYTIGGTLSKNMPHKDESQFWHVRVPRGNNRKTRLEKMADKLGLTNIKVMEQAVDMWLEKHENA